MTGQQKERIRGTLHYPLARQEAEVLDTGDGTFLCHARGKSNSPGDGYSPDEVKLINTSPTAPAPSNQDWEDTEARTGMDTHGNWSWCHDNFGRLSAVAVDCDGGQYPVNNKLWVRARWEKEGAEAYDPADVTYIGCRTLSCSEVCEDGEGEGGEGGEKGPGKTKPPEKRSERSA